MSHLSKMLRSKNTTSFAGLNSPIAMLQIRRGSTWASSLGQGPGVREKRSSPSATHNNESKESVYSVVPTSVLLRSLLVTTISSNWALRVPSLSILLFITKARGFLFNVDRNPLIRWILRKTMYDHFCAGEREPQVRNTIRQIKDLGIRGVILTYAREAAQGASSMEKANSSEKGASVHCENIQAWRDDVLKTVDLIGEGDCLAPK